MPFRRCVPGCCSGYTGTNERVSLFCMPSVREVFEKWKRAIPRQETDDFSFESKHVRVCAKHFDPLDVIRTDDFFINGDAVSLPRDKSHLMPNAIPRVFDILPAYFTKPKP